MTTSYDGRLLYNSAHIEACCECMSIMVHTGAVTSSTRTLQYRAVMGNKIRLLPMSCCPFCQAEAVRI